MACRVAAPLPPCRGVDVDVEERSGVEIARAVPAVVGLGAGAVYDRLAEQAARLGLRVAYRVRLSGFDAVARLVEAGVGVAVLPLAAVDRCRIPELAEIRLTDAWGDRRFMVCVRDSSARRRASSPKSRASLAPRFEAAHPRRRLGFATGCR